uniref:Uncharacterized protein n=1 Tax=uncultured Nocardioidaceae bacterium TaxID=253824 RepID=A0A6J4L179_9ACTN|nr:MAG: hypothetical protein AVDCRST_MAG46-772 [uncultured Nocardioidaceae bacterium]
MRLSLSSVIRLHPAANRSLAVAQSICRTLWRDLGHESPHAASANPCLTRARSGPLRQEFSVLTRPCKRCYKPLTGPKLQTVCKGHR